MGAGQDFTWSISRKRGVTTVIAFVGRYKRVRRRTRRALRATGLENEVGVVADRNTGPGGPLA